MFAREVTNYDAGIKNKHVLLQLTLLTAFIENNVRNGGVVVFTLTLEPVLLSLSPLTVGVLNVESDWPVSGDTQKSANQLAWQIQVVNPDPAFDCTRPRAPCAPS